MIPDSFLIQPPTFDSIVAVGMIVIPLLVAIAWSRLISGGVPTRFVAALLVSAAVMAVSATAAFTGTLASFERFPPPMAIMIAAVITMGVGLGLSPVGERTAREATFVALIGLQAFRLPLELVMHRAATLGIMPGQLTYTGLNFDILTGAGALAIALALANGRPVSRSVLWAWNGWGIACLLMIVFIAVATSPMVRLFGDDPRSVMTWVLFVPYVWLPVVLVTIAIAGHAIITRKLLLDRRRR